MSDYEAVGRESPFFPGFYGNFIGGFDVKDNSNNEEILLAYNISSPSQSLITLTFSADSISFVLNT